LLKGPSTDANNEKHREFGEERGSLGQVAGIARLWVKTEGPK